MFPDPIQKKIMTGQGIRIQTYGDTAELGKLRKELDSASGMQVGFSYQNQYKVPKGVLTLMVVPVERRQHVVEAMEKSPLVLYEDPLPQ